MKIALEIIAVLGLSGMVIAWVQGLPKKALEWWSKRNFVEFSFESRSSAMQWLAAWFHASRHWERADVVGVIDSYRNSESGYVFTWGEGDCDVVYRGVRLRVNKSSSKDGDGRIDDVLKIKLPKVNRDLVVTLLSEARDVFEYGDSYSVLCCRYDDWQVVRREPLRSVDSLVLPGDELERVISDASRFFSGESWYRERGLPYRRGYLFAGVPGSGKSTLVSCIASSLKRNVNWVDLLKFDSDSALLMATSTIAPGSIVLIEDIDSVLDGRGINTTDTARHVSFTGLLNALDSMMGCRGSLVIMTTNHPDRLDPALIRPGRVDLRINFGNATPEQAKKLFERFYSTNGDEMANIVRDGKEVSMATLQSVFLEHVDDPPGAIAGVRRHGISVVA